MAFPFSEDHDMIREAARGFLQDWYDGGKGPERIYQSGTAFDAQAWTGFAKEQGMAGIAIDEDHGGAGLGDLGRVVVMEELGASLCAIPFLSTCAASVDMVSELDLSASNGRQAEWLERLARGQTITTYFDGHDAFVMSGGLLSGSISGVLDGQTAEHFFFTLKNGDALSLFDIPASAKGITVQTEPTLDPTRSFSTVSFEGVRVADCDIIGHISHENLKALQARSFIALAAECLGGAQKCLDLTLDYAAQRVQFGRPIASFQAIKHRCADMFILLEAARSATYAAAVAPPEEKTEAALLAKAYATDAFFKIAGDAIQMHGGIGFTWEYPLHFFFKRARANRSMFGSSTREYDKLADLILGEAA